MNIFILEQLITRKGNILLTWQQAKLIRSSKSRGRKPNWFKKIEEEVLENPSSRLLKAEYQIEAPNQKAIRCKALKVSADKRKKEWIVFEKTHSIESGKVIKKESKSVIIEHWRVREDDNNNNYTTFEKCKGCNLGRHNNMSCIIRHKQESWHQVVRKVQRSEEVAYTKIPITACISDRELINSELANNGRDIEISIVGIEEAVIQRVVKDRRLKIELSRIASELKEEKVLDIYTDGSMVADIIGGKEVKKMGIGFVIAVDNYRSPYISFSSRIIDWPSSTRAELGAIWAALLVAPYKANLRIFSDSKAAIEGIQNF